MKLHNVLCPIDYSEHGAYALDYAALLARESGAVLHIVHTWQNEVPLEMAMGTVYAPAVDTNAEESRLTSVVPMVEGSRIHHELLNGDPANEILNYAHENEVDLIVMATHGRTGVSRLLMGSVAEHVLRKAECPVLTIRQKAGKLQPSKN